LAASLCGQLFAEQGIFREMGMCAPHRPRPQGLSAMIGATKRSVQFIEYPQPGTPDSPKGSSVTPDDSLRLDHTWLCSGHRDAPLGGTLPCAYKLVGLGCRTQGCRPDAQAERVEMQRGTCPVTTQSASARDLPLAKLGAAMCATAQKTRCSASLSSAITRPSLRDRRSRVGEYPVSCG